MIDGDNFYVALVCIAGLLWMIRRVQLGPTFQHMHITDELLTVEDNSTKLTWNFGDADPEIRGNVDRVKITRRGNYATVKMGGQQVDFKFQ
jgi:hypothetical protein